MHQTVLRRGRDAQVNPEIQSQKSRQDPVFSSLHRHEHRLVISFDNLARIWVGLYVGRISSRERVREGMRPIRIYACCHLSGFEPPVVSRDPHNCAEPVDHRPIGVEKDVPGKFLLLGSDL